MVNLRTVSCEYASCCSWLFCGQVTELPIHSILQTRLTRLGRTRSKENERCPLSSWMRDTFYPARECRITDSSGTLFPGVVAGSFAVALGGFVSGACPETFHQIFIAGCIENNNSRTGYLSPTPQYI
ncbi:hypothetical protein BO70DRAFT_115469 [Aspergillus heteromorphus CBS 117.55]|uniref:Uncharacterized protein n=1 Tax=Aspergillus heteromorphus CBS 117.55 TaxID=1448321 RepID=A0A317VGL9_9EURO|nr:uncharacterized protein BO70DRAFT_115469 [Aspergillus heteromorphus CBS 117.55]PWY72287.1 hypothetical protein BO70DRAFT_115469 [Aspergillus heteromorphus CBS 117.55]